MRRYALLWLLLLVPGAYASEAQSAVSAAWSSRPTHLETGWDWLRLSSNEWLKGEIIDFRTDSLYFDSDNLGKLAIAWDDVAELWSDEQMELLINGDIHLSGTVVLDEQELHVGEPQAQVFPRAHLLSMVPSRQGEWQRWGGRISLGLTSRSGNSSQREFAGGIHLLRRTLWTRFEVDHESNFAEAQGVRTVQNHHFRGRYDLFFKKYMYLRLPQLDLFHDRFQNIDLRATPTIAVGASIYRKTGEDDHWDVDLGAGLRYVRYVSVPADAEQEDADPVVTASSAWEKEVVKDMTFRGSYALQYVVAEGEAALDRHLKLQFIFDFIGDISIDVAWYWDHLDNPQADDNGAIPEEDDHRLVTSIGWDF